MQQNSAKQILHSFPENESKHFLNQWYLHMPLSSLPMKSFLSYVAACDFTENKLHHFLRLLKFFRILYNYSRYSVTLVEKSHA